MSRSHRHCAALAQAVATQTHKQIATWALRASMHTRQAARIQMYGEAAQEAAVGHVASLKDQHQSVAGNMRDLQERFDTC